MSILFLVMALVSYSIRELLYHHKLKWMTDDDGFWGEVSDKRKYKRPLKPAPDTWYYRYNDLTYVERFPLAGSFLVSLTDAPHQLQFWFFNFLALAFTLALGFNWWLLLGMLIGVRVIHGTFYKLLSR